MSEVENGNAREIVIEIEIETGGIHGISGFVAHHHLAGVAHRRETFATEIGMVLPQKPKGRVADPEMEDRPRPGRPTRTRHSACRRLGVGATSSVVAEEVAEANGHRTEAVGERHTMIAATAIPEVDPKRRDGGESGTNVTGAIDIHQKQTFGANLATTAIGSNET